MTKTGQYSSGDVLDWRLSMTFTTNPRLPTARKYALIVIDVTTGFTDPDSSPLGAECSEVVESIQAVLRKFRELNLPIVYTTVVYDRDNEARVFREKIPQLNCLNRSQELHEIDDRVSPLPGEKVIEKKWASAFFKTELDAFLRTSGIDGVIVTGLTTSGCVRATVVDAIQHEYRPIVIESAVGDRDPDAHRSNLRDIAIKYGDVFSLSETLELLEGLDSGKGA
ncbi:isochorismatase family protein [Marinobacter algicola]|uniref:isochorismatase family protein n=1 Tax=Marinobacter algicola TaxID=236100 RepID=UPI003BACD824